MNESIAKASSKNRAYLFVLLSAALIIVWFLSYYCNLGQYFDLAYIKSKQMALMRYAEEKRFLVIGLYMGIYILVTAFAIPSAFVLTAVGGMLFGLFWGTIIVSFSSTIGATCAFLGARFFMRDAIQQRFSRKLKRINEGMKREGAFYLFALRLAPTIPFFLINIIMGLTPLKTTTFFWVSQLGMLPATIAYVNAGTQLSEITSFRDVLSADLIIALMVLGLLPLGMKWAVRGLRKRAAF